MQDEGTTSEEDFTHWDEPPEGWRARHPGQEFGARGKCREAERLRSGAGQHQVLLGSHLDKFAPKFFEVLPELDRLAVCAPHVRLAREVLELVD